MLVLTISLSVISYQWYMYGAERLTGAAGIAGWLSWLELEPGQSTFALSRKGCAG